MSQPQRAGLGAAIVSAVQRTMFGLPPRRNAYTVERAIPVATRDGARLLTDHYAPIGLSHGTVLIRSPYGRSLPESLLHGRMLAERGYHVVIQSVRGTGGSTGTFRPIAQETADAHDTVAWLHTRPWFNGTLATLGGSYLGWAQWALLQDPPPEARAAVVLVGPHDFRRALHPAGSFALADFLGWSAQLAKGGLTARRRVAAALRQPTPAAAAAEALCGAAPWFGDWLDHPDPSDPYWQPYTAESALHNTTIPILLIGGWHDVFVDQTLEQYRCLRERDAEVALTIGPWTHLDTAIKSTKVVDTATLAWFDQHLAGATPRREGPVRIHVTGAGQWRTMPSWPPKTSEHVLALDATGRLTDPATARPGNVEFAYDPNDPTPAIGGRHISAGAGRQDNRTLERRDDVLVFTSDPLDHDLDVLGSPQLRLLVETDQQQADLFVRLCDVDDRDRSWNVTESFVRITAPTTIELGPCAHRFRAGHRLRVQVSGGAYPRYPRSPRPVRYTITCSGSTLTMPADRG